MFCKVPRKLSASGLNSSFNYTGCSYDAYIEKMRAVISKTCSASSTELRNKIIAANSPAESRPTNTDKPTYGVLLLHGLYDSCHIMQSLFEHYQQKNYLVRNFLLPGHGTVPGDLLHVTLEDWLSASLYAIESFKNQVDKLIVIGLSTGANLAIYHAMQHEAIDALILFSPALKIKTRMAYHCHWYRFISWACPRSRWLVLGEERDYAKYHSFTTNSVHQVARSSTIIMRQQDSHPLSTPAFFILSAEDEIVDTPYALDFFSAQTCKQNRMIIYSKNAMQIDNPRVEVISSTDAQNNILDYSHPCLTVAPNHPHYGKDADYQDFHHYDLPLGKPFHHKRTEKLHFGAMSPENIQNHHLQRLRYNPDFDGMIKKIDAFIKTVE